MSTRAELVVLARRLFEQGTPLEGVLARLKECDPIMWHSFAVVTEVLDSTGGMPIVAKSRTWAHMGMKDDAFHLAVRAAAQQVGRVRSIADEEAPGAWVLDIRAGEDPCVAFAPVWTEFTRVRRMLRPFHDDQTKGQG